MTCGGFRTSTRGSRAARWNSASAEIPTPGLMTPPRYSPAAEMASNVVAVPKSTTMIGEAARPPEPFVGGHPVHNPIGADLGRRGVEVRHAGVGIAVDDEGLPADVALHHLDHRPGDGRNDRGHHDVADVLQGDAFVPEELAGPDPQLVGGPLVARGQPPASANPIADQDAEDDVRVADVDGKQHGSVLPAGWPSAQRQTTSPAITASTRPLKSTSSAPS